MFQSTRPRGARRRWAEARGCYKCFNPRARAGRDSYVMLDEVAFWVSIHAPARGATVWRFSNGHCTRFQSTRPRGARPQPRRLLLYRECFNPRARAGRDTLRICATYGSEFQSTRPRGARRAQQVSRCRIRFVSIHAPARGATRPHPIQQQQGMFQSTRPRGARRNR